MYYCLTWSVSHVLYSEVVCFTCGILRRGVFLMRYIQTWCVLQVLCSDLVCFTGVMLRLGVFHTCYAQTWYVLRALYSDVVYFTGVTLRLAHYSFIFVCVFRMVGFFLVLFASCKHDYPDKCKICIGALWLTTRHLNVYEWSGDCFRSRLLFFGVVFGRGFLFSSASVSNFISRLLFFSGVIQCDRDDGCRHEARDGGFLK